MANIIALLSQYELLERTASYISTLDLFHLAVVNQELYTLIRKSEPIFDRLKSVALCDGHGLKMRQDFKGIYELGPEDFIWGKGRKAHYDEELEVLVWNLSCDSTNGLPCIRCAVNVCEECRYVPRVQELPNFLACPKQHHLPSTQVNNVVGFCVACDVKVEHDLPFALSEYCDCDQYTRWICLPCKVKERQFNREYFKTRTRTVPGDIGDTTEIYEGMWDEEIMDVTGFWCPCGKRAPKDGNKRCSWCRRRFNLRTWKDGDASRIPFFDDDPCYPKIAWDNMGNQIMYPPLDNPFQIVL